MAVGGNLYLNLVKKYHSDKYEVLKSNFGSLDQLVFEDPEVILLSKEFLIYYIFEITLKGIRTPLPIFRLSPYLANQDDLFWATLERLKPGCRKDIEKLMR